MLHFFLKAALTPHLCLMPATTLGTGGEGVPFRTMAVEFFGKRVWDCGTRPGGPKGPFLLGLRLEAPKFIAAYMDPFGSFGFWDLACYPLGTPFAHPSPLFKWT